MGAVWDIVVGADPSSTPVKAGSPCPQARQGQDPVRERARSDLIQEGHGEPAPCEL